MIDQLSTLLGFRYFRSKEKFENLAQVVRTDVEYRLNGKNCSKDMLAVPITTGSIYCIVFIGTIGTVASGSECQGDFYPLLSTKIPKITVRPDNNKDGTEEEIYQHKINES